jgi:uncharacterized membrane protein
MIPFRRCPVPHSAKNLHWQLPHRQNPEIIDFPRKYRYNVYNRLHKIRGDFMLEVLEIVLQFIVEIGILLFEFIGVGIIIWTSIVSFYKYVTRKPDTRIYLGKGLAMGLEFKLGSEILRTVIVREWKEIAIVAGIIALRAALTFLIHWEIKEEEKEARLNGND